MFVEVERGSAVCEVVGHDAAHEPGTVSDQLDETHSHAVGHSVLVEADSHDFGSAFDHGEAVCKQKAELERDADRLDAGSWMYIPLSEMFSVTTSMKSWKLA